MLVLIKSEILTYMLKYTSSFRKSTKAKGLLTSARSKSSFAENSAVGSFAHIQNLGALLYFRAL